LIGAGFIPSVLSDHRCCSNEVSSPVQLVMLIVGSATAGSGRDVIREWE